MRPIFLLDYDKVIMSVFDNGIDNGISVLEDRRVTDLDNFTDDVSMVFNGYDNRTIDIENGRFILYPTIGHNYNLYKILITEENNDSNAYTKTIQCSRYENTLLLKDKLDETEFKFAKIGSIMEYILLDSEFVFGYSNYEGTVPFFEIKKDSTRLSALIELCHSIGYEMQFRKTVSDDLVGYNIDILSNIGTNKGKIFVDGKDLTQITRTVDSSEVITAIKATGTGEDNTIFDFASLPSMETEDGYSYKKGTTFIISRRALSKYSEDGQHLWGVLEDSTSKSPTELFDSALGVLRANDHPKYMYNVGVQFLESHSQNPYELQVGDVVSVKDETLNPPLYLEAKIRHYETSECNPIETNVTFGNYVGLNISDTSIRGMVNGMIENLEDGSEKNLLPFTSFTENVREITKISYRYLNSEFVSFGEVVKDEVDKAHNSILKQPTMRVLAGLGDRIKFEYMTPINVDVGSKYTFSCFVKSKHGRIKPYIAQLDSDGGNKTYYYGETKLSVGKYMLVTFTTEAFETMMTCGFECDSEDEFETLHWMLSKAPFYIPWSPSGLEIQSTVTELETKYAELKMDNDGIKAEVGANKETITQVSNNIISSTDKALKEAKAYADKLKTATDSEINDVTTEIGNLNDTMNGAFKDGVISEAEAKAIKENLKRCKKEKLEADKQYEVLYSDTSLVGEAKTNLASSKVLYDSTYAELTNYIMQVIADSKATTEEVNEIDRMNTEYDKANSLLTQRVAEATKSIENKKKQQAIEEANKHTNGQIDIVNTVITQNKASIEMLKDKIALAVTENKLEETVAKLNNNITKAKEETIAYTNREVGQVLNSVADLGTYLEGAYKDGIIDDQEKEVLKQQLTNLDKEKADVVAQTDAILSTLELKNTPEYTELVESKSNFVKKHSNLMSKINEVIGPTVTQGSKSNFVVSPTTYNFTSKDKIVIKFTGVQVDYGYLYGIGNSAIYSDSGTSNTLTFGPQAEGTYNCYIGTYDANTNWIQSNDFTVIIKDGATDIPVSSVTVNPSSKSCYVGDYFDITATVNPSNATNKTITWSSTNTNIATVSSSGRVTARKAGTVTIKATSNNGKVAQCSVRVDEIDTTIPVTGVELTETSKNCIVGDTFRLTHRVKPSNATNTSVTWSSSNRNVATVSQGEVTTLSKGTCSITVRTADGGYTSSCTVNVEDESTPTIPVSSITVMPSSKTCHIDNTFKLTATVSPSNATDTTVTFSSSHSSVATVDSKGLVTAKSIGTTTITARTHNNKTATCTVEVIEKPNNQLALAFSEYKISLVGLRESMNKATNKIAEVRSQSVLDESKNYVDTEVTIVNKKVTENKSSIDILKNEIKLGVTQKQLEDTKIEINTSIGDAKDQAVSHTNVEIKKTNEKVSGIDIKLNGITSKVEHVEKEMVTVDGKVVKNTERIQNAENKITPTAITNAVSEQLGAGGSIKGTSTTITKDKFSVSHTGNKSRVDLAQGSLFTYNGNGNPSLAFGDTNIIVYDYSRTTQQPIGEITSGLLASEKHLAFLAGKFGTATILGYEDAVNQNQYIPSIETRRGNTVNFSYANAFDVKSGDLRTTKINEYDMGRNLEINSLLVKLNSLSGPYQSWLRLNQWNSSKVVINNGTGNADAYGTCRAATWETIKSATEFDNRGEKVGALYQTGTTQTISDIGSATIQEDGKAYIDFDFDFLGHADTKNVYHITYDVLGPNRVYTIEKNEDGFVVEGPVGTEFTWEVKCKKYGENARRYYTKFEKSDEVIDQNLDDINSEDIERVEKERTHNELEAWDNEVQQDEEEIFYGKL
ncbi:MAG: phage tail spike protein [Clostridium sp.]|uniref:phage tail spike protein n=1 Tax=Clostridium sp. TaxID=1506 RepID=UPI003F402083